MSSRIWKYHLSELSSLRIELQLNRAAVKRGNVLLEEEDFAFADQWMKELEMEF